MSGLSLRSLSVAVRDLQALGHRCPALAAELGRHGVLVAALAQHRGRGEGVHGLLHRLAARRAELAARLPRVPGRALHHGHGTGHVPGDRAEQRLGQLDAGELGQGHREDLILVPGTALVEVLAGVLLVVGLGDLAEGGRPQRVVAQVVRARGAVQFPEISRLPAGCRSVMDEATAAMRGGNGNGRQIRSGPEGHDGFSYRWMMNRWA